MLNRNVKKNQNKSTIATKVTNKPINNMGYFEYWQEYNEAFQNKNSKGRVYLTSDNYISVDSFTKHFFIDHKLSSFLKTEYHSVLQLGASGGRYIHQYQQMGWNVLAYDYSPVSIDILKKNGIPARLINLNDSNSNALAYEDQLKLDIQNQTNIFMIRILEYLDLNALTLLLHCLIDHSAPGSVMFIAGIINNEENVKHDMSAKLKYFKPSFFGPRTDFELLQLSHVNFNDEITVVQKRVK